MKTIYNEYLALKTEKEDKLVEQMDEEAHDFIHDFIERYVELGYSARELSHLLIQVTTVEESQRVLRDASKRYHTKENKEGFTILNWKKRRNLP